MSESLYLQKNILLKQYVAEVSPMDFYRDMFPAGSFEEEGRQDQQKANGILCSIRDGVGRHSLVFDDLKEIEEHLDDDFVIISPLAYFGKRRSAHNASMFYGLCFDLDYVGVNELQWILDRLDNPHFPRATYIANSGEGIHLYYLLKKPIPLYKSVHNRLNALKHDMTDFIWNKYTSQIDPKEKQYQGIFQGFRMVGSKTKTSNDKISVFKTGDKVDIEFLNRYVAPEFRIKSFEYETSLTLDQAKEKYPVWYQKRIVEGKPAGRWTVKRDLYDWWLRKIQTDEKLSVGHRYFCISVLASYAIKCGIKEDELREDAYGLLDFMNGLQNDFTVDDIEGALNFYQESFVTFPRAEIEKISGLDVPSNKRNGRTQEQHLKLARFARDLNYDKGESWRDNSPHSGRKKKNEIVQEWKQLHPDGKKIDCARETGLHINTVYKWWNSERDEAMTMSELITKKYIEEQYELAVMEYKTACSEDEQWEARKTMARLERIAMEEYGFDYADEIACMKSVILQNQSDKAGE